MPPVGFEPVIPTTERPQTHDLVRAATGIGGEKNILDIKYVSLLSTPSRASFRLDKYLVAVERRAEMHECIHVNCSLYSAVRSTCTAYFNVNKLRTLPT